jgi:hypothetical protein
MGPLFALGFWIIVGGTCAIAVSVVAKIIAVRLTRSVPESPTKRGLINLSSLLPFACVVWAGAVVIAQGVINETWRHRDLGFGDDARAPLFHGWSLSRDDSGNGVVHYSDGYPGGEILGVLTLQVVDPWILGSADSKWFSDLGRSSVPPDRYFLLNAVTGACRDFSNQPALQSAAAASGLALKLEPVDSVFNRYRFTWFDGVALFLLFAPPGIAFVFLLRSILRLRRSGAEEATAWTASP